MTAPHQQPTTAPPHHQPQTNESFSFFGCGVLESWSPGALESGIPASPWQKVHCLWQTKPQKRSSRPSYSFQLKPCPDDLILVKCVLKGIQPGPPLRHLQNGQDITLFDGLRKGLSSVDIPGSAL
ncbi:GL12668 [Drosophila persimilis]|uniref:GL12668 n=1 Tax=Drosophila persimilis TaxID=7234 RepID=B4GLY4_DROPE|nr:GL12668 [Drosophila persimilis]